MNLRKRRKRLGRWGCKTLGLFVALGLLVGVGVKSVAASTIAVDCSADPSALSTALATAVDGDTLAVAGTCKGTFEISHSLTLAGSPAATLDGQGTGTVLTIDRGTTVVVRNVTVTGGSDVVAGAIRDTAGGILSYGNLTLADTIVRGNGAAVAQFRNGAGGILSESGSLTLAHSTVSGNTATATAPFDTAVGGIAISPTSSLTLTDSTVSGNSASTPSDAFGGILLSATTATITNSTVAGNSASASGGPAAFSIATGGVSNAGGSLTVTSSTLSGNSVSEPNGGFLPPAAGISNAFDGTLVLANSVIAGQSGGPSCLGLTAGSDGGYNLEDGISCGFGSTQHSLSSTNPLLDPAGLRDNGGPTQTIALQPDSPAVDAIPPGVNGCGTTIRFDQRGTPRPQSVGCDIGAYELLADTTPPVIQVPGSITVNATGPSGATAAYSVSASDPDDPVASLTCAPASGSTFPIGTTTVNCTATDTHENKSTASFTIKVKGAAEQLRDLLKGVTDIGPGSSLAAKVTRAHAALAANDLPGACSILGAFIHEVNAQSGQSIPADVATTLVNSARRIRNVVGC